MELGAKPMIKRTGFTPDTAYLRVRAHLEPGLSGLLALGCGDFQQEQSMFDYAQMGTLIGVDAHKPSLDKALAHYKVQPVCGDMLAIAKNLPSKMVDVVCLIDAIEHVTKSDAYKLLHHCERIARRLIVIFTPVQLRLTPGAIQRQQEMGDAGEALNCHLSTWTPEYFSDRGYEVELSREAYHRKTNYWQGMGDPADAMLCFKYLK